MQARREDAGRDRKTGRLSLSFAKAKAITKTLRWYHVGFAFLWATTFVGLSYPASALEGDIRAFKLCNQMFLIMAVVAMAVVAHASGRAVPNPLMAIAPGLLLGGGVLLFYLTFYFGIVPMPLAGVAGVCIGVASGMFYVLWQFFFTSEGASRTALYIPLSAVASSALSFVIQALPFVGAAVCVVVVMPLLAGLSLFKALKEVEPDEFVQDGVAASFDVRAVVRDLWKPVFCVCSIGFVWKLVSHLFEGTDPSAVNVVLVGFSAAALVIALVELLSEKGFEVLRSYQVLFPLVTGAFLLPTLFGVQYAPVLSGTLMFGFEVVNLLLIITCAVYANERALPSTYVYALCVCPTLAAMLAGDSLGMQLSTAFAYDLSFVVGVLFLCVYVLSLTMFLVSWTKRRKRGKGDDDPGTEVAGSRGSEEEPAASATLPAVDLEEALLASLSATLDALDLPDPLSQREREVASLMLRGYSVAGVSRKLFISENTVRGHTKSIYRKLDVHSKQQMIDLISG